MARLRRVLRGAALGVPGALALWAGSAAADDEEYRFRAYLDGSEIGRHVFTVSRGEGSTTVVSDAQFEVKLLFVTVYRYRHQAREHWRNGCLHEISSTTQDNGTEYRVHGTLADSGFLVRTGGGGDRLPGCVMSFAYWNPDFLDEDRLLNAQTGDYLPVTVTALGGEEIAVDGRSHAAQRHRLTARGMQIDLWYAAGSREWLALESVTPSGKVLRYERVAHARALQSVSRDSPGAPLRD